MKHSSKSFDLVTLGQTQLEFCGEQMGSSLKDMRSFKKLVGGFAPSLAIGSSRLGLKTALISVLAKDDFGQFLINELQKEKIDLSKIRFDDKHASALKFSAIQNKTTLPTALFKQGTPVLAEQDLPSSFIASSHAFAFAFSDVDTLTYPAIYPAIIAAKEAQTKIIFALNNQLTESASEEVKNILPLCDVIVGEEKSFQSLAGTLDTAAALNYIRSLTNALLLLKNDQGCYLFPHGIPRHWQNAFMPSVKVESSYAFDTLTAFTAGFLKGWLQRQTLEKSCQLALACQTISQAQYGTSESLPSEAVLTYFMSQHKTLVTPILHSPYFSHLHHASTHPTSPEAYFGFSFGYHQQWQKMADTFQLEEATIQKAKILIAQGLNLAAESSPFTHLLGDEKMPADILEFEPLHLQFVRSVEAPNEVPLQFRNDPDISRTLSQWPKHHQLKVTLTYHPDDRYALRGQQEATLGLLHRACRNMGLDFIIELNPPANSLITTSTYAHIIQRLYEVGVYPDWWQMNPPRDQRSWDTLERVIADNDPYCRGVVVLSHTATLEQLEPLFEFAVKQKYCKGFVLGRNLLQPGLEQWLAKRIADHTLIDMVATQFHKAITIWNKAQQKLMNNLEKMPISA